MATRCGWPWLPTWPGSKAPPESTPNPTSAASSPGAATREPRSAGGPPAASGAPCVVRRPRSRRRRGRSFFMISEASTSVHRRLSTSSPGWGCPQQEPPLGQLAERGNADHGRVRAAASVLDHWRPASACVREWLPGGEALPCLCLPCRARMRHEARRRGPAQIRSPETMITLSLTVTPRWRGACCW